MNRTARWLAVASLAVVALFLIGYAVRNSATRGGGNGTAAAPPTAGLQSAPAPSLSAPARRSRVASGPFRLVVRTAGGHIDVPVAPLSAASHQPVDPPKATVRQLDTADWIVQSTYPARPGRGTAYIYGHACLGFPCAFNNLVRAKTGNIARITTRTARLTYRIDRIGLSPKTATALPAWAADSTIPDRIVLVTCSYEANGASPDNLVVIAHLVR
ncbi:MAG: class F sortase [Actinobacteria bacterium]|nr:class F sortase [Actinomycetota bacterium]